MKNDGLINQIEGGWKYLTDLLCASIICKTGEQIGNMLMKLKKDPRYKLHRIKHNFNGILVNFEYKGMLIGEI